MTSRENFCELVSDALVDPAAPRPPGMQAHLAACPACRRLRDAHRAAERLRPPSARAGRAIGMEQVLARVRRRRRSRAVAGAAAAAAVALVLAVRSPHEAPPRASGDDVFALAESVRGYSQREVAAEDPILVAFAPLTDWLAPPPRRSLKLPSFAPFPGVGSAPGAVSP